MKKEYAIPAISMIEFSTKDMILTSIQSHDLVTDESDPTEGGMTHIDIGTIIGGGGGN